MKTEYALQKAVDEALRFIDKAQDAIAELQITGSSRYAKASHKEVAAAKRASMDLTRVLVEVRSPNS